MNNIKINAFIGPLPPPLGGVAMINQSFQALVLDGFEPIVFDTSNKSLTEDLYAGVPWSNLGKELAKLRKLKAFLKDNRPDIANLFITSGYSILRDIFYLMMLHKQNIPVIIHFHSKTHGEFALTPKRLNWVSKYFNKYANRIILLSETHYSFFVEYFGKEKCVVIENFVNYAYFQNEISNKSGDFLFVGRLSREKGFFDLLDAVKILKQNKIYCRIQVIGLAPTTEIDRQIEFIINSFQLKEYFVFNGATFGEEKHQLFRQASCLIFPSHLENSPVVLKEAIAAKLAIVASDINANQLILKEHNNCKLFKVKNSEYLAKILMILLENPDMVNTMCKSSELIKGYDKSIAQNKLINIMHELC